MTITKKYSGLLLSALVACFAVILSANIPYDILSPGVTAIIIGIALNPLISKTKIFDKGIVFSSKTVLKLGIILMGINLSFNQVVYAGKYALILLMVVFVTAFGIGNLLGKLFKINWKLTNLLAISTSICGGSAVAAVGPVIKAKNSDIAYAISATFIFDIITVILFPIIGRALGLTDTAYGLWTGTSVNDTSSVVAAGYGFSDAAGNLAVIVKLTRTLFIIPLVFIFHYINRRFENKSNVHKPTANKPSIFKVIPWFIVLFVLIIALKSIFPFTDKSVSVISNISKFFMTTALAAIGLQTSFTSLKHSGLKPMILGFTIDTLVVFVTIFTIFILQF